MERRHEGRGSGPLGGDDPPRAGHRGDLEEGVGSHADSFAKLRAGRQSASLRLGVWLTELDAGQPGEELAEGLDLIVAQRVLEQRADPLLVVTPSLGEDARVAAGQTRIGDAEVVLLMLPRAERATR